MTDPRSRTVRVLWREQPGLFRGYIADVALAFCVGAALVLGGRARTQAASWDMVNANGGPVLWGAMFALGGVALLLAGGQPPWVMAWALWIGAGMYFLLAASFFTSVLVDPDAGGSFVGALFAGAISFTHLSRADAYREGPRWTR